ncbi:unnamed protein product [Effrenium voratum]|nr:unnamed protein product [Effrenium voratum]
MLPAAGSHTQASGALGLELQQQFAQADVRHGIHKLRARRRQAHGIQEARGDTTQLLKSNEPWRHGAAAWDARSASKPKQIDPLEKKAFFDKHKIVDNSLLKRLNEEIMKKRDTKESVLLKLDELRGLEDMGDPKGYLEMKVEEIENGEFRGKTLEVPEVLLPRAMYGMADTYAWPRRLKILCALFGQLDVAQRRPLNEAMEPRRKQATPDTRQPATARADSRKKLKASDRGMEAPPCKRPRCNGLEVLVVADSPQRVSTALGGVEGARWLHHAPEALKDQQISFLVAPAPPLAADADAANPDAPEAEVAEKARRCVAVVLWLELTAEGELAGRRALHAALPALQSHPALKAVSNDVVQLEEFLEWDDRVWQVRSPCLGLRSLQAAFGHLCKPRLREARCEEQRRQRVAELGARMARCKMFHSTTPCTLLALAFCRRWDRARQTELAKKLLADVQMSGQTEELEWQLVEGSPDTLEKSLCVVQKVSQEELSAAPKLLDAAGLLAAASEELDWDPTRAWRAAEELYQAGLISCPRTDATDFPVGFDVAALGAILGGDSKAPRRSFGHEALPVVPLYGKGYLELQLKTLKGKEDGATLIKLLMRRFHASRVTVGQLTFEFSFNEMLEQRSPEYHQVALLALAERDGPQKFFDGPVLQWLKALRPKKVLKVTRLRWAASAHSASASSTASAGAASGAAGRGVERRPLRAELLRRLGPLARTWGHPLPGCFQEMLAKGHLVEGKVVDDLSELAQVLGKLAKEGEEQALDSLVHRLTGPELGDRVEFRSKRLEEWLPARVVKIRGKGCAEWKKGYDVSHGEGLLKRNVSFELVRPAPEFGVGDKVRVISSMDSDCLGQIQRIVDDLHDVLLTEGRCSGQVKEKVPLCKLRRTGSPYLNGGHA